MSANRREGPYRNTELLGIRNYSEWASCPSKPLTNPRGSTLVSGHRPWKAQGAPIGERFAHHLSLDGAGGPASFFLTMSLMACTWPILSSM